MLEDLEGTSDEGPQELKQVKVNKLNRFNIKSISEAEDRES